MASVGQLLPEGVISVIPSPPRRAILTFGDMISSVIGRHGDHVAYTWDDDGISLTLSRSDAEDMELYYVARITVAVRTDRKKVLPRCIIAIPPECQEIARAARTVRAQAEVIDENTVRILVPDWLRLCAPRKRVPFDYGPHERTDLEDEAPWRW